MVWFTAGYGLIFLGLGAASVIGESAARREQFFRDGNVPYAAIILALTVVPIVSAWLTMDLLHRLRPRRWFQHGVQRRARLSLLGLATGGVGALGITTGLVLLDSLVPTSVLTAGTTALVCAAVFPLIPKLRQGHCAECGYDLRGGPAEGRCPECGAWANHAPADSLTPGAGTAQQAPGRRPTTGSATALSGTASPSSAPPPR